MKVIAFVIESGWVEAPFWFCPVSFDPTVLKIEHLHTTPSAGAAPSLFSGVVSGLFFSARGSLWPIESREGTLSVAESDKPLDAMKQSEQDELDWQAISIAEAIEILSK